MYNVKSYKVIPCFKVEIELKFNYYFENKGKKIRMNFWLAFDKYSMSLYDRSDSKVIIKNLNGITSKGSFDMNKLI